MVHSIQGYSAIPFMPGPILSLHVLSVNDFCHDNCIDNKSEADSGEGHRGQMTPSSEPYLGRQNVMYLYENNVSREQIFKVFLEACPQTP